MDLGLERAGMKCAWQVEIDEYARRILTKHWPDVPKFADVRAVGKHNLASVDVIAGGFPCQDVSVAGKRAGLAGQRSGLWAEFFRIIGELRPRVALIENVPGLLTAGLDRVLCDLASIGYDAEWEVISACAFGAPHTRRRVFVIAHLDKIRWRGTEFSSQRANDIRARCETWEASPRGEWRDVERWFRKIMENDNEIIPAAERSGVDDGIPAWLDRIKGLGNAVVPAVAEWIGRQILRAI